MITIERVISGKNLFITASIQNPTTEIMEDASSIVCNIGIIGSDGVPVLFSGSPYTMTKQFEATGVYGVAIPMGSYIGVMDRVILYVNATVGGTNRGAIATAVDINYTGMPSTGPGTAINVDIP